MYAESVYCYFLTKNQNTQVQLEWRFKMILRLYIEVGWAVSQLEGIDLIRSLTIFPIFCFDRWMWGYGM